jgi:hypothetical protein
LRGRVLLRDPTDGIIAAARPAFDQLAALGFLHGFIAHVRSSQAFALNLFGPLGRAGARDLLRRFNQQIVEADPPEFEYSGPGDPLGERTPGHDHVTQVDVLLRGRTSSGETHVALIEVKLSEIDFSLCSAYLDPRNPALEVCRTAGPYGGDPARCHQLTNHGGPTRRQYDVLLGSTADQSAAGAGCPYRLGANQPMRNVALARWLLTTGQADAVSYALCAPEHNPAIWRRWAQIKPLFALSGVELVDLPATSVLSYHRHRDVDTLARRYPARHRRCPEAGRGPSRTEPRAGRELDGEGRRHPRAHRRPGAGRTRLALARRGGDAD